MSWKQICELEVVPCAAPQNGQDTLCIDGCADGSPLYLLSGLLWELHGTNHTRFHSYCRWRDYSVVCWQLLAQSESLDPQDIFMGNKRGISKDLPNEHYWWDTDWNIFGCIRLLVVITYCDHKQLDSDCRDQLSSSFRLWWEFNPCNR